MGQAAVCPQISQEWQCFLSIWGPPGNSLPPPQARRIGLGGSRWGVLVGKPHALPPNTVLGSRAQVVNKPLLWAAAWRAASRSDSG